MTTETSSYFDKGFWKTENLRYVEPHFRLQKIGKVVNALAAGRTSSLLDVGCGPAALAFVLEDNVHYHGMDIAIQVARPNLREVDFVKSEIAWEGESFDFVVASGVFEYLGEMRLQKMEEIRRLLRPNGRLIVSYVNFQHIHRVISAIYNNVQPIASFRGELERFFTVTRSFPVAYNWQGTPPRRPFLKRLEMHFNVDVPIVARLLAVEYCFICTPR
jgi:SAM-dependent methyltransferase